MRDTLKFEVRVDYDNDVLMAKEMDILTQLLWQKEALKVLQYIHNSFFAMLKDAQRTATKPITLGERFFGEDYERKQARLSLPIYKDALFEIEMRMRALEDAIYKNKKR
jgi:hypothetical protein